MLLMSDQWKIVFSVCAKHMIEAHLLTSLDQTSAGSR
jgi:hypothetical protein